MTHGRGAGRFRRRDPRDVTADRSPAARVAGRASRQRNDNGSVAIWEIANSGAAQSTYDFGLASAGYRIAGAGDFNGDGRSDILWRNDNFSVAIWQMANSGQVESYSYLGVVSTGWHIQGTGDFSGDVKADIL